MLFHKLRPRTFQLLPAAAAQHPVPADRRGTVASYSHGARRDRSSAATSSVIRLFCSISERMSWRAILVLIAALHLRRHLRSLGRRV